MKRIIAILLIIVLFVPLSVLSVTAEGNTPTISPRYTYFQVVQTELTIDETTGQAYCMGQCAILGSYVVETKCTLQIYTNAKWYDLKTWTSSGIRAAHVGAYWTVSSGYVYRVYSVFRVFDSYGNVLEEVTSSDSYVYPQQ